jgi:hypothetical protein
MIVVVAIDVSLTDARPDAHSNRLRTIPSRHARTLGEVLATLAGIPSRYLYRAVVEVFSMFAHPPAASLKEMRQYQTPSLSCQGVAECMSGGTGIGRSSNAQKYSHDSTTDVLGCGSILRYHMLSHPARGQKTV